jgi:hypothetical protein
MALLRTSRLPIFRLSDAALWLSRASVGRSEFRHLLQLHDQTGALPLAGSEDSDSSTSITWEAVSRFIESEWSKGIDGIRLTG